MKTPLFSTRRSAFTLVELLTVIAIIGVLAAILIPTVAKVRKSSQAAGCSASLRQIGAATLMYAGENKGRAPVPNQHKKDVDGKEVVFPHWYVHIAPFLGVKFQDGASVDQKMNTKVGLVIGCPLAPKYAADIDLKGIGASYGWTSVPIVGGMPPLQGGVYLSTIPNPARTIMIGERWGRNSSGDRDANWGLSAPYDNHPPLNTDDSPTTNDPGALRLSHGGRANFLFFDGHVSALMPSETYDSANLAAGNLWRGL